MTVVWAWAELGDNVLQNYNIRQYWLIMSVLSVKKFNPDWKRVFVVDKSTYEFILNKGWINLWDEVIVENFSDTEFGNLYDIKIYSWPKIYSYGLIDDDILILDVDIVFLKPFVIPERDKMCGQFYNFYHFCHNHADSPSFSLRDNWKHVCKAFELMDKYDIGLNYRFEQDDIILIGSPIYVPKDIGKYIQTEVINHIKELETLGFSKQEYRLINRNCFWVIEEEYPIAEIGKRCKGLACLNRNLYRHGFTNSANFNINKGYEKPEKLLEIPVFELYIKV